MIKKPSKVDIIKENASSNNEVTFSKTDVTVDLSLEKDILTVFLQAELASVKEVTLIWENEIEVDERSDEYGLILSDHWERGYGDLEWKKPKDTDCMPWYFLFDKAPNQCVAYGVKVRPSAMCWWEIKDKDLFLHLDVRCGTIGVKLNGRRLKVAEVLMKCYETDAFEAGRQFCKEMCTDSICGDVPVYGSNNWYYAYGKSSREDILKDSAYLAFLTEGIENRPFMVIDDGWQSHHWYYSEWYNGGPWKESNADYGDMKQLATDMKKYNVRPGIWFRPIADFSEDIPKEWRFQRDAVVLDISVPEVLEHVSEDLRRIKSWGFELVKHDFSTWDIFGRWGFYMGKDLTDDGWTFADTSRTTAEIIVAFYEAIKKAAGDMIVLGCNCIGHLCAGLVEANRTGDDTSGVKWERTKKMGVNTLAFRMMQHGTFFVADADCLGITGQIPWEKNRQWMEILAESGTPFFVSVKLGVLTNEQEEELKLAYKKAAVNTTLAKPLDWKKTKTPECWETVEGIRHFEW